MTVIVYSQELMHPLAGEFWDLIEALESMAQRNRVSSAREFGSADLFSRFAGRLRTLHARSQVNPTSRVNMTEPLFDSLARDTKLRERHWLSHEALMSMLEQSRKDVVVRQPNDIQSARTSLHNSANRTAADQALHDSRDFRLPRNETQYHPAQFWNTSQGQQVPDPALNNDDLLAISQSLIDPDFINLDRILNFDDMILSGNSEEPMGWNIGSEPTAEYNTPH